MMQREMQQERDRLRQQRDTALQQVAQLERLNDEILRGVPEARIVEPEPQELEEERVRFVASPLALGGYFALFSLVLD